MSVRIIVSRSTVVMKVVVSERYRTRHREGEDGGERNGGREGVRSRYGGGEEEGEV